MKKSLMVLFVAVALSAAAIAQTKMGTATLQGYAVGEFKVNADIERQITAKVVKPIEAALAGIPPGKVSIIVYGYADRNSGTVGTNDEKGQQRAEAVARNLAIQFPNANIISTTRGDMIDSRMVIVEWKIAPTVIAPAQPTSAPMSLGQRLTIVIVAVIALIALIIARSAKAQRVDRPQPVAIPQAVSAPAGPEPKWVFFKSGVYDCEALITPKDDVWLSPFTINGKPIFSPTERGIIKSLKGCMVQKQKNDTGDEHFVFEGQPEQLAAEGKFKFSREGVSS